MGLFKEILVVVIAVAVLATTVVGVGEAGRTESRPYANECINNLQRIDQAKQEWAFERHKGAKEIPTWDDLRPFLDKKPQLVCPLGGIYIIGAVRELPKCVRTVTPPPWIRLFVTLGCWSIFWIALILKIARDLWRSRTTLSGQSVHSKGRDWLMIFLIVVGLSTCALLLLTGAAWQGYKHNGVSQHELGWSPTLSTWEK